MARPPRQAWDSLWAVYLGLKQSDFSDEERATINLACHNALRPVPEKWSTQMARKWADPFLRSLPDQARLSATSVLKRVRNPGKQLLLLPPEDWALLPLYRNFLQKKEASPLKWNGKKGAICLTHDIDNKTGYHFVREMLDLQEAHSLPGTFNFVTSYDYKIDPGLVQEIEARGFESGLHCLTHDIGLAYRKPEVIRRKLKEALSLMPGHPKGYRSAALSISPELLRVVSELGLKYDSTLQISNPIYHSVGWPFPFYLEEFGLWEVPLTLQDDVFLRDSSMEPAEILNNVEVVLNAVIEVGGIFVMNLHPHLMVENRKLYSEMLSLFARYSKTALATTTGNVVDYMSQMNGVPAK